MPALQTNADSRNPNALNLTRVAEYERTIKAPLVRVWENVMDYEHLPWLHKSSFDFIEIDEAGDWGWRTWSNADHTDHIELTVTTPSSYVARSYQAGQQISEIWTTLTSVKEVTEIKVEFDIPDIAGDNISKLGNIMLKLYTHLWDEDEAMMMERNIRLHEQRDPITRQDLGNENDLHSTLENGTAVIFQLGKLEFQVHSIDGQFFAHSTICPHRMGPLRNPEITNGVVQCPWHGYQFDLSTGDCVSPADAGCQLPTPPRISIHKGRVIASASSLS
jgi:nitrite reductase/ring-hydroxylating ferredoxin subunit